MKGYILSVAGIVLISAVFSIILPGGKMGKFIKGTMKVFVLVVLVAPFTELLRGKTENFTASEFAEDTVYLEKCASLLADEDKSNVEEFVLSQFSVRANAEVEREAKANFPRKKIVMEIFDFGIFGQDEHIDIMTRIQAAVGKEFGCEAVVL